MPVLLRVSRRSCEDGPLLEEQETEGQRQLHSLLLQQLHTNVNFDRSENILFRSSQLALEVCNVCSSVMQKQIWCNKQKLDFVFFRCVAKRQCFAPAAVYRPFGEQAAGVRSLSQFQALQDGEKELANLREQGLTDAEIQLWQSRDAPESTEKVKYKIYVHSVKCKLRQEIAKSCQQNMSNSFVLKILDPSTRPM